jgi:nucleotide-binding universal stress UspA family protein
MAQRAIDELTPTCILAMVDEEGTYDYVRRAAVDLARSRGARLILWDSSTASSFTEPVASEMSAEGTGERFGALLTDVELEQLGRPQMARQVLEAREAGIDAWARLASEHGADALADEARQLGADLIVLPEELDDPGLVERLRGETVEKAKEESSVPVAVVDRSGAIR